MDIELVKCEPPELEVEVKLKNEEKPQPVEEFIFEKKKPSTSETVKQYVLRIPEPPLITCCVCGEKRKSEEMLKVPRTQKEVFQWSKILGKQLLKNFTIMSMVCRIHFNKTIETIPFVNPYRSIHYVKPNESERIRCCYCRTLGSANSMTPVSQSEPNFDEWVRILGRNFNEHFEKSNYGVICRIHFAVKWEGNRPEGLLPVAHLNAKNKSNEKTMCIFCGEPKSHCELTMVPPNPTTLKQWADILGVDFYKRALARITTFICRSYFDVEWEKNRPRGLLPCAKLAKLLSNKIKCEPVLIENIQVKSEEPEIDIDSDQKSFDLLESKHQEMESEMKPEKDSDILCSTPAWIKREDFFTQDSDLKRIKIEVKEEQD